MISDLARRTHLAHTTHQCSQLISQAVPPISSQLSLPVDTPAGFLPPTSNKPKTTENWKFITRCGRNRPTGLTGTSDDAYEPNPSKGFHLLSSRRPMGGRIVSPKLSPRTVRFYPSGFGTGHVSGHN